MTDTPKISLAQHPSQDSGIGTSIHNRSDYDLAMSLAIEGKSSSSNQPSLHRPDIPLPTSFPRTADHPAQRIIALANGRRMSNAFHLSDVANTIRLVDNFTGDSATDRARIPHSVQSFYERRIRARYALPALAEVAEGASPRLSHTSAAASPSASASASASASHRSSALTEGEDYSFISFDAAEAQPLILQVPTKTQSKKSSDEIEERLPSPVFPPENGSSRFRERFSLDGPEVFRASAESVVGEEEGKAGAKEEVNGKGKGMAKEEGKERVCGSKRVARVWRKLRKAFGKSL